MKIPNRHEQIPEVSRVVLERLNHVAGSLLAQFLPVDSQKRMLGRNSSYDVIADTRPPAQTGQMNLSHAPFMAHVVYQVIRFAAFANKSHKNWLSSSRRCANRLRRGLPSAGDPSGPPVVDKLPLHSPGCKKFILVAAIKNSFGVVF